MHNSGFMIQHSLRSAIILSRFLERKRRTTMMADTKNASRLLKNLSSTRERRHHEGSRTISQPRADGEL
ncbi:MAG: hypothetical protein OJF47_003117 [Nitrospira sp.]|nr:MAG: hypothetical protein OJF47_003117 [Nitrospira sp.]